MHSDETCILANINMHAVIVQVANAYNCLTT